MGTLGMGLTPEQKEKNKRKLDSSNNASTVQVGKGAENNLDEVVVTGKKPKKVGQTRSQQRKDKRMNNMATRRADRTAENNPSASKDTNPAQYEANLEAEKDKIRTNREGRKQFLRNFGSQLSRGVQADQVSKGAYSPDKSYLTKASEKNQGATGAEQTADGKGIGEKSETQLNAAQIEQDLNNKNNSIGNDNKQMAQPVRTKPEDEFEDVEGGFTGESIGMKISPISKKESKDSNPKSFMQEEFMKRLGYK